MDSTQNTEKKPKEEGELLKIKNEDENHLNEKENAINSADQSSSEEPQLKELLNRLIKMRRSYINLEIHPEDIEQITASISAQLGEYLKQYIPFFTDYFAKSPEPVFAYDIEERWQKVLCFCGIEMRSPTEMTFYIQIAKNAFWKDRTDTVLQAKIRRIFTEITAPTVIAHGNNAKERDLAVKTHKKLVNTENALNAALITENDALKVNGCGLGHFEELFGYKRLACKFFKHNWHWKSYFRAMDWSYYNLLTHKPPRICTDCHHPQDVILYCMEDAIVSLFIHMWSCLHEEELTKTEKSALTK